MVENSSYFIGDILYTRFGEPVMTTFLNDYQIEVKNVPSPFFGQPAHANFIFDFRNTQDPVINTPDHIDFKFFGELVYLHHFCNLEHEPFEFLEAIDSKTSQIVITDSAFSCGLNNVAKSLIGHLRFNEDQLNTFFGVNYLKFDTSSFKKHMPIFETKLGKNKPLRMNISFKDFSVKFG